jgi:sugar lactone lactonase YvrE
MRRALILAAITLGVFAAAAPAGIFIHHHTQGPFKVTSRNETIFVNASGFLPRAICKRKVKWSLKDGAGKVHKLKKLRPHFSQDWINGQIYASVGRVPADAAPGKGRLRAKQRCPNVAKTSGSIKMRITDPNAPSAQITNVRAPDMVAGEGGTIRFSLNVLSRAQATLEYEIVPGRWVEVGTFLKRKYYAEPGVKKLEWKGKVRGKLPPAGHYRVVVRPRDLSIANDSAGPPAYGEFNVAREIKGFDGPVDVQAAPDGQVVVADQSAKHVVPISADDKRLTPFGAGLEDPLDVAFGPGGTTYVADGSGGLARVEADGTVNRVSTTASLGRGGPQGIAASIAAKELYVADGDEIEILDFAGGAKRQIADDAFATPRSVAVAPDGTLWVADQGARTLFHFAATGERLGTVVSARGELRPRGVDVDRAGNVLYTDSAAATVKVIDAAGTTTSFGRGLLGSPGGVTYADGLGAAGLAGDVYVVDRNVDRVLHFRVARP